MEAAPHGASAAPGAVHVCVHVSLCIYMLCHVHARVCCMPVCRMEVCAFCVRRTEACAFSVCECACPWLCAPVHVCVVCVFHTRVFYGYMVCVPVHPCLCVVCVPVYARS